MNKRQVVICVFVLIAVLAGLGVAFAVHKVQDIEIKEETIQSIINEKLPIEKEKYNTKIAINSVEVKFYYGQVQIFTTAKLTAFKTEADIIAKTRGNIVYDPLSFCFYFDHFEVDLSDSQVNSDSWFSSQKSVVFNAAEWAVGKYLDHFPVYKLKDDFKSNSVKLLLESIEVKEDKVIAHFSVWRLTKTVIFYCFIFIASVLLAIAQMINPNGPKGLEWLF